MSGLKIIPHNALCRFLSPLSSLSLNTNWQATVPLKMLRCCIVFSRFSINTKTLSSVMFTSFNITQVAEFRGHILSLSVLGLGHDHWDYSWNEFQQMLIFASGSVIKILWQTSLSSYIFSRWYTIVKTEHKNSLCIQAIHSRVREASF